MKQARANLDAGSFNEAERGFKDVAIEYITEAEPHHMLALMACQASRLEEAGNHIVEDVIADVAPEAMAVHEDMVIALASWDDDSKGAFSGPVGHGIVIVIAGEISLG